MVVVEWEDAFAISSNQHTTVADALSNYTPCVRRTVGFWIGQTPEVTALAMDDDRTSLWPEANGGLFYVPTANVRRVVPLCQVKIEVK